MEVFMVPVGSYRFSRGMPGGVDPLIKVGRLDKLYSVKLHGFWLVGVTWVMLMVLMGWLFCPRLPSAKLFCPKLLPARLVFAVLVDIFFLFEGPSSWIIRVFLQKKRVTQFEIGFGYLAARTIIDNAVAIQHLYEWDHIGQLHWYLSAV